MTEQIREQTTEQKSKPKSKPTAKPKTQPNATCRKANKPIKKKHEASMRTFLLSALGGKPATYRVVRENLTETLNRLANLEPDIFLDVHQANLDAATGKTLVLKGRVTPHAPNCVEIRV